MGSFQQNNHVCFGDLNRAYSQKEKGGQLFCFQSQKVWNILHSMIHTVEEIEAMKRQDAVDIIRQNRGLSKNKLIKGKKIKECTLKELIKMGDIVVCKEGQKHAHYLKEHKPNSCVDV